MAMDFFFCRLLPPHARFIEEMSERERRLMAEHAAYLTARAREGTVVVFGPVGDRAGAWGLVVAQAQSEAALRAILDADPTIKAEIGFTYEITPMLAATLGTAAGAPPADNDDTMTRGDASYGH